MKEKNPFDELEKAKHEFMMALIHGTLLGILLKFVIRKLGMQLKKKYRL